MVNYTLFVFQYHYKNIYADLLLLVSQNRKLAALNLVVSFITCDYGRYVTGSSGYKLITYKKTKLFGDS